MGKRGPQPKGEYGRQGDRTAVLSTRLQPDTRRRLVAAAQASGRSLSQELEHRLRRTFVEDDRAVDFYGSQQNAAILKLIGITVQSVGTSWLKKSEDGWLPDPHRDPGEWLRDPTLFDGVLTAIIHVLLWFRPGGDEDQQSLHYHSTAEQLLADIRAADPSVPMFKRSTREHAMAKLKDELGELSQRPHPYDHWTQEPPVQIVPPRPAKRKRK